MVCHVFLTLRQGNGILRINDIIQWVPVSIRAGSSMTILSFQRGLLPLLRVCVFLFCWHLDFLDDGFIVFFVRFRSKKHPQPSREVSRHASYYRSPSESILQRVVHAYHGKFWSIRKNYHGVYGERCSSSIVQGSSDHSPHYGESGLRFFDSYSVRVSNINIDIRSKI